MQNGKGRDMMKVADIKKRYEDGDHIFRSQSIGILLAEIERLNRLLESLTPGGSEFHDNPEYCVEWAKSRLESNWRIAKKAIIRSRELEGEVKRLRECIEYGLHAAASHQVYDKDLPGTFRRVLDGGTVGGYFVAEDYAADGKEG